MTRLRSRCIDRLRRRQRRREHRLEPEAAEAHQPVSPSSPDLMLSREIWRALSGLNAALFQVLYLRYFEDLSCQQVAARLGLPLGTVKSRSAAAFRLLRQAIDAEPLRACA